MNAHEELARELFIADNFNQPREQSIVDWEWFNETKRFRGRIERYNAAADAIHAAGYTKINDAASERAAAVIKDAVEFTPYWKANDPTTHQDPYQNAARAVIAALRGDQP